MLRSNKKGFTLIELMIVVVIIGILAAIAIPNYVSMQDRARESSVKGNAHAGQLKAEDEAVKENGTYPDGIVSLLPDNIKNPFDPDGAAFSDGAPGEDAGVCYYAIGDPATSYVIVANGKDGTEILNLTNNAQ